jgi:hypothetical protein
MAMYYAVAAGLVVAPIALLSVEAVFSRVRVVETFGGALFAVTFFAITSIAVAFGTAVIATYIVKSLLLVGVLYLVSFDGVDEKILAISICTSSLAYLTVQTVHVAGRGRRLQRRIARAGKSIP